jgi:hypothetical protein
VNDPTFAISGKTVSRQQALRYLRDCTDRQGHCRDDMLAIWHAAVQPSGEEARDTVMALTNYSLEIDIEEDE